jgi:hypothetical protein
MRQLERRLAVARAVEPPCPACAFAGAQCIARAGRRQDLGIPVVYEVRAFWEDAAVDHGTTTGGQPALRLSRRLETHCAASRSARLRHL